MLWLEIPKCLRINVRTTTKNKKYNGSLTLDIFILLLLDSHLQMWMNDYGSVHIERMLQIANFQKGIQPSSATSLTALIGNIKEKLRFRNLSVITSPNNNPFQCEQAPTHAVSRWVLTFGGLRFHQAAHEVLHVRTHRDELHLIVNRHCIPLLLQGLVDLQEVAMGTHWLGI